jgi:hypothetical protein
LIDALVCHISARACQLATGSPDRLAVLCLKRSDQRTVLDKLRLVRAIGFWDADLHERG